MIASFSEAFRVWLLVAAQSFGGPAGQIAVMHRILVEEKKWVDEDQFLHALNYCMLLPGPEAQQLATYIGWLLHGVRGGLMAGGLFVLPGYLCILLLSILYAGFQTVFLVQALFYGLKPAVMAVVVEAVVRVGKKALKNRYMVAIAALAFVAIFFLNLPYPLIVVSAGGLGVLGNRLRPQAFQVIKGHQVATDAQMRRPPLGSTVRTILVWLLVWWGPVLAILLTTGSKSVFSQVALFFSKLAVVTFGGAYAVLAYMAQETVATYGWLTPGEMLDGLGLAETTPGPLIQVVGFVGYLGAYRHANGLEPWVAGVLGSTVATWVTYAPCFLFIFAGAPYIQYLRNRPTLSAALSAITAAVVGVIFNLAVWFSLHVLFSRVSTWHWGPIQCLVPDLSTLDPFAFVLAVAAMVAMLRFHLGMLKTLAISGLLGILWRLTF
ncbi:MAG: hypothetical protein AMXMBFR33_20560 [Candidatus Xenobia bacterium]